MDNEELEKLLARCGLRDQKALEVLYQRTAAYLNAVAYRILGSREASSEVLQEAFLQIWDNASSYAVRKSNPLTWMSSIVRYRAIDKVRHEHRHQNRPAPDEEIDILLSVPSRESQEDLHHQSRLNEQLKECLAMMNDNFRESIELAYLYGYSREELAETLGANVNTIKSWLRRGAAKLKVCLEGHKLGGTTHE